MLTEHEIQSVLIANLNALMLSLIHISAPALMDISDALRISASSCSSPVSIITCSSTFAAAQASLQAFTRSKPTCSLPVSYTHLDVYKRQTASKPVPEEEESEKKE